MERKGSSGRSSHHHARSGSADDRRRVATPRRSTKGPLESGEIDDPLADTPAPPPASAPVTHPHQQPPSQLSVTSPLSPDTTSSIASSVTASRPSIDVPVADFSHLLRPENFHPLPSADVPPAFLSTSFQPPPGTPLPALLAEGHFRAAAISAALALSTSTSRTDHQSVFALLNARLASLALLDRHGLAAQEAKLLSDLNSALYRHPLSGGALVPWELRVLAVRLQAIGFGDWRRGIMAYYDLARDARDAIARAQTKLATSTGAAAESAEADRSAAEAEIGLWTVRLRDLGVRVAGALVEMGDLEGAARHLATLPDAGDEPGRLREALVWLCVGDISAARRCLAPVDGHGSSRKVKVLKALILMTEGDFEGAVEAWTELRAGQQTTADSSQSSQQDESDNGGRNEDDAMIAQNLAVCLLYTGHVGKARAILESLIDSGPAFYTLIFNLATVYELCSERARELKLALSERVAARGPSIEGGERIAADFKL